MIKGIIFDMDGVISDTQKLHAKVESEIFSRYGISLTPEEITNKYAGVKATEFFKEVLDTQNEDYNLSDLINEKWKKMEELASKSVDPIEGSQELIKELFEKGFSISVASASNYKYVEAVLKSLDLIKYFKHIVSGDMVKNGKPDPESFLLAASKMQISPENCLVIEDGRSGMEAAEKANMKCIGLVENKEKDYPTNILVTSLNEVNMEFLERLN